VVALVVAAWFFVRFERIYRRQMEPVGPGQPAAAS
jgi:hypothetical protein